MNNIQLIAASRGIVFCAATLLAGSFADRAIGLGTLDVIVSAGDVAPDGNGAFESFFNPSLNDAGEVAFVADFIGTSAAGADDRGLFRGDFAGGIVQIARRGQSAPDGNGKFFSFSSPPINDAGQVGVFASFSGTPQPIVDGNGIYRSEPGQASLVQIVRTGQTTPDGNGKFMAFNHRSLNEAGQFAFSAQLTDTQAGSGDSRGVYLGDGGPLTQLARRGQAAPGGGAVLNTFSFSTALNDGGEALFIAELSTDPGTANDDRGVFRHNGLSLANVAAQGDAVPNGNGTIASFPFDEFPTFNNAGQFTFAADLAGATGGINGNRALFLSDGATVTELVRKGQPAPDGNGTFNAFHTVPPLNNAGQTAIVADFAGSIGGAKELRGLFRTEGSAITRIARMGQLLPDGVSSLGLFFHDEVAMNDRGQLAFLADRRVAGDAAPYDQAIFFHNDSRGLAVIAKSGDPLLGSTITSLIFLGNSADEYSSLNNSGQLAFRFGLADGRTGIALWTIPEPTSIAMFAAALLTIASRPLTTRLRSCWFR